MMILRVGTACAALALACAAGLAADLTSFLEGVGAAGLSPEERAEVVTGYLPPGAIDAATVLQAPPEPESPADKADVALLRATIARATADRWLKAVADDASVYDRFDKALGIAPNRKHLPRLVRLLNRAVRDVMTVTNAAKEKFGRARPFQRFALARVCGMAQPPAPDPSPAKRTSYPSGHASISWAVALVMMEAAPERAQALITRAVEYGDSRVVCGAHFPSDVEAGRLLAAVVVDKLMAVPEFRRDVMCAKREYGAVLAGEKSENLPACQ